MFKRLLVRESQQEDLVSVQREWFDAGETHHVPDVELHGADFRNREQNRVVDILARHLPAKKIYKL